APTRDAARGEAAHAIVVLGGVEFAAYIDAGPGAVIVSEDRLHHAADLAADDGEDAEGERRPVGTIPFRDIGGEGRTVGELTAGVECGPRAVIGHVEGAHGGAGRGPCDEEGRRAGGAGPRGSIPAVDALPDVIAAGAEGAGVKVT